MEIGPDQIYSLLIVITNSRHKMRNILQCLGIACKVDPLNKCTLVLNFVPVSTAAHSPKNIYFPHIKAGMITCIPFYCMELDLKM